MRKFIVKHFALNYTTKIFGIQLTALRCTRIMFPYFFIMGLVISLDPDYPKFQWWDILLVIGWVILMWLSQLIPKVSYFDLYPLKWHELDDDQKWQYGLTKKQGFNLANDVNWDEWTELNKKRYQ